jgi:hypothetical protein
MTPEDAAEKKAKSEYKQSIRGTRGPKSALAPKPTSLPMPKGPAPSPKGRNFGPEPGKNYG